MIGNSMFIGRKIFFLKPTADGSTYKGDQEKNKLFLSASLTH